MMEYLSRAKWLAAAFLFLFPALAGAAPVTVVLPSIKGRAGAELKVPIVVQNPNKLAAFETYVIYDPAGLEPISDTPAESSDLTQNSQFESQVVSPGRLRIQMAQADAIKGPGPLCTIAFRIKDEQALRPLRLEGVRAISEDLKDLEVVVVEETIGETGGETSNLTRFINAIIRLLLGVGVFLILLRIARLVDCVI
jgi:hypothetical protein